MRLNASLVLGNSHIASGMAMSLPASYIPIGGYHIFGEEEKMTPVSICIESLFISQAVAVSSSSKGTVVVLFVCA